LLSFFRLAEITLAQALPGEFCLQIRALRRAAMMPIG
jgi:hypothetical protein